MLGNAVAYATASRDAGQELAPKNSCSVHSYGVSYTS